MNRQVHASSLDDRFATLFYGVFDGATRTLQYVNAGHNPPMVIRKGDSIAQLEPSGPPVGIFADFDYQESAVELSPGDLILAYTDGVVEAESGWRRMGRRGLLKAAAESDAQRADEIVHAIFASMDEFSGGCQTDDATVVVVQVH